MKFIFLFLTLVVTSWSLAQDVGPKQITAKKPAVVKKLTTPIPADKDLPPAPEQYVLFAFDGSLNLNFWEQSRKFARDMNAKGKAFHFTYFLSGPYFLAEKNKSLYDCPGHGKGKSAIGFGGDASSIPTRVNEANAAFDEGNEMGSHANGHYDAQHDHWSADDWNNEFKQFYNLIFRAFANNNVTPVKPYEKGMKFDPQNIKGFRAPLLATTPGLFEELPKFGFEYDTSLVDQPSAWPVKRNGIWSFPLAELSIVGTAKHTLSMDYNFYYSQSRGKDDLSHKALFKKQMLDSYYKYFQDNYNGNRAPVQIGHHFSQWNGGAYWEAMQEFAQNVCGLPRVRCVTFTQYKNWIAGLNESDISLFRGGHFKKEKAINLTSAVARPDLAMRLVSDDGGISSPSVDEKTFQVPTTYLQFEIEGLAPISSTSLPFAEITRQLGARTSVEGAVSSYELGSDLEVDRREFTIENLGMAGLRVVWKADRALLGDLPEAHYGE